MIQIIAKNHIKNDKIGEFLKLAAGLVEDTRKKDSGCIRYELVQDLKNPQLLIMLEEWDSQEALNSHMNSEHFKEVMAASADFFEKAAEIHVCKRIK